MVETHHPEGWRRPPGGQLRYWIRSEWHGILGGVGFAAAGMQPGPPTPGWPTSARWCTTTGSCCCPASGSTAWRRRPCAWRRRGWRTTGRPGTVSARSWRRPSPGRGCPARTAGRREVLRRAPQRVPGWSGTLHCAGGWAAREYGRSPHPDGRVRRRIAAMGAAWTRRLGAPLPALFPGRADQAACRLLSSGAVTMEHVPESHFEQTVARCRAARLVLAIQDTTTLNHDGPAATAPAGSPAWTGRRRLRRPARTPGW